MDKNDDFDSMKKIKKISKEKYDITIYSNHKFIRKPKIERLRDIKKSSNNLLIKGEILGSTANLLSNLKNIKFKDTSIGKDIEELYYLIDKSCNVYFNDSYINSRVKLIDSNNIKFNNMNVNINSINNCNNLIFENCRITIDPYKGKRSIIKSSENIIFINCTIKYNNKTLFIVNSENISIKNCNIINPNILIKGKNSSINIKHSEFQKSNYIFDIENCFLYLRFINFNENNKIIKQFKNTEYEIIGIPPEFTISMI